MNLDRIVHHVRQYLFEGYWLTEVNTDTGGELDHKLVQAVLGQSEFAETKRALAGPFSSDQQFLWKDKIIHGAAAARVLERRFGVKAQFVQL